MDFEQNRSRWSRMLAQADHFAELDNPQEACARARACLAEIDAALASETDGAKTSLERERHRAARAVASFERALTEWTARVAARSQRYYDNQHRVYEEPLPKKGIE